MSSTIPVRSYVYYLLLPVLLLLAHAASYYPFLSDDALISLRYSQRLLDGFGLTWSDGPAVEGYSNLAWVLATAFLGWIGMDLITASRLLGVFSFVAVLFINLRLWYQVDSTSEKANTANKALLWSQYCFALAAPIAVWSLGGLEQPFVALFSVWALANLYRYLESTNAQYLFVASLALALLCLSRPDGPLICVSMALGLIWVKGVNLKTFGQVLILAIFPIIAVSAQLGFRWFYYQDWVPNTAHIKVGFSALHALQGLLYLAQAFVFLLPWSFLYIRESVYSAASQKMVKLASPTLLLWFLYVIFIGGDIFPGLRHVVLMLAIMTLVSPVLLRQLAEKGWFDHKKRLCLYIVFFITIQLINTASMPARYERWEWDGQALSYTLKQAFADKDPLFAVTTAGTLPYFTGFRAIDMLGLNDYHIARYPASDPSKHYIAHGHADGAYVYRKKPDLVSFCGPWDTVYEPCFVSGQQLHAISTFKQEYVPARFRGFYPYEFTGIVWVYKYSEKIGIQKYAENTWRVPAYLLSDYRHTVSTLGEDKRFSISVSKDKPAKVSYINIAGPIEVSVIPAHSAISVTQTEMASGQWSLEVNTESKEAINIQQLIIKTRALKKALE